MPQPALCIRNLKFKYTRRKKDPWVIDIPMLDLDRGEQMLLTGGSGRGKSTLLNVISGLMEPTRGQVLINGRAIHTLQHGARDRFRGRNIGIIFQSFNLLHGFSAAENVMAALMFSSIPRHEHRRRAVKLLKHLGISRPRRRPERMSIGQQQRVAVARAVACDPVVVLADEPTASLDPDNAHIAIELIRQACRENHAALLCVSHDPMLAERFERRASLDALTTGSSSDAVVPVPPGTEPGPPVRDDAPEVAKEEEAEAYALEPDRGEEDPR